MNSKHAKAIVATLLVIVVVGGVAAYVIYNTWYVDSRGLQVGREWGPALAAASDLYIFDTTAQSNRRSGKGELLETSGRSLDCGCSHNADTKIIVDVRKRNDESKASWSLCIDSTNPQLTKYAQLVKGDSVSFDYVDQPVQQDVAPLHSLELKTSDDI